MLHADFLCHVIITDAWEQRMQNRMKAFKKKVLCELQEGSITTSPHCQPLTGGHLLT